jgi:uncharacterized protein involved in exopolysaccharide biosynthesis
MDNGHDNGHKVALGAETVDVDSLPELLDPPAGSAYRLLLRRRRYLLRCSANGLALFALLAFMMPARYESVARLMPPDNSELSVLAALSGRGGDSLGLGLGLSNLLGLKSSGALLVGILSSNTVADEVIGKFDLRKTYGARRWETARKRLANYTSISEDRKSGIITIRVRDHVPGQARQMCQAYIENLNRLVVQLATSSARREREFLEERLKVAKVDLDRASVDLSQFASKNSAIDLPQQGKAMVEAAAMLQGQLIAAQSELKGLGQIYGPEHSRVRAVEARIAELQRQLDKLGGKDLTDDPSSSPSLYPPIRKLPLLALTYTQYYRRAKIQETLFESLTKQYEFAKVQEAKEIPSVRVLDAPTYPERHVSPPRLFIIVCGVVLGLAVGIGLTLGRVAWNQVDDAHPRKIMALETWDAIKEDVRGLTLVIHRRKEA